MECGLYSCDIEQVMCYGEDIWCVRDSPDLFSGGMFVPDKKWNAGYIHVVYSCSMPDKVWRRNSDYIHVIWGEHLVCEGVT